MHLDEKLKVEIRNFALQNAIKYEGRANPSAVIGRILAVHPELKSQMKELGKEIAQIVAGVNTLPNDKQLAELQRNAPEFLEEKPKEQRKGLKPIPGAVTGRFITRLAPSASGPLHIGHAFVLALNAEYCRMYDGKLLIRIEDTNPAKAFADAYAMIPDESRWLTSGLAKDVHVQSDSLGAYYDYAEQLISKSQAYVCTCDTDTFKTLINAKKACPCRDLMPEEHAKRFAKMFGEYAPGEAVLRVKTDTHHPNPAMRDWPAMRISDAKHPRTGTEHRVWPLMNFSVAVDDHLLGVTHTIRGKDHMDNAKRQQYLYDYMGWTAPSHLYIGRINFTGFELSTSKMREEIERGKYAGWDDIRLPTIAALRRRGYQPEAFIKYAVAVGVSQTDKSVAIEEFFKSLNAFNKEVIDPEANRYFFIDEPMTLRVHGAPEMKASLRLHPDDPKRGSRAFETHEEFYIAKRDYARLKGGRLYRLMDCLNFRRERGGKCIFDSQSPDAFKDKGDFLMHWLPKSNDLVRVEVLMPDGSLHCGLAEKGVKQVKQGAVIQFERFGFCRLDEKGKDALVFWLAHR